MGSDYRCPFCGKNCEKRQSENGGNYFYIECENGFKCKINNSVLGYVTSTTMNLLLDISNNISGTI